MSLANSSSFTFDAHTELNDAGLDLPELPEGFMLELTKFVAADLQLNPLGTQGVGIIPASTSIDQTSPVMLPTLEPSTDALVGTNAPVQGLDPCLGQTRIAQDTGWGTGGGASYGRYPPMGHFPPIAPGQLQCVECGHTQLVPFNPDGGQSTIGTYINVHDQGMAWNSTIPPQPANAGYAQQGGYPTASSSASSWRDAPTPGPWPVASTSQPAPAASAARYPTQDMTEAPPSRKKSSKRRQRSPKIRKCGVVDANGQVCGRLISRNFQRHWVSFHAPLQHREEEKVQGVRQKNKPVVGLTCPVGCLKMFSRYEHFRRHLRHYCQDIFSEEEVWRLSDEATHRLGWQASMERQLAT